MTQVDPSLWLSSSQNQQRQPNNALGQDAFLKLLITQLQNQDPSNPIEDREFIAQLATFSQLEQLTKLNSTMEYMYYEQKSQQLMALSELIGKSVEWLNEKDKVEQATVTGVKYSESGDLLVQIDDDKWIEASNLISIIKPTSNE
ncbi:flagellar hook assembly protein FlgD [Shouchella clausii]|jgi:flagellar basal-body rod modification protein FlgD|uniref:Flagellar hook assembly protein FlgD n=1 Tax=Shouchella clausii TaxID=79880 RepID=A0A268S3N1_SHOCL|nr:flagellar hook assembly protein FlgD [Shouchella clausii]PAD44635.1 flagellar hook assembly protein FlgD [Bacillus sp. 7520-S]SPU22177.1 flagellar basal body rod modification protein [Niallia circulans]AST97520.1 flagellar hook assembly protein FlgD [Shouchella clausii]MBU8594849.1 flagellar hook assembly protein FlgD [Shouchella clausii]MCM3547020.1 flagellar hook assembly protein FlgD [Shouchella clausii]